MNTSGRFITIEGQDGAGKSTNLAFIKSYLESQGVNVHTTREPGGTTLGETLRQTLLYQTDVACGDLTELLLMFAARAQHLEEVILPKLKIGEWVISDRFTDATYAYQGAGRGIASDQIQVLETLVQQHFKPALTLVLDIPLDVAKSRGATDDGDRFEQQRDQFKHRVREYYLALCKSEPDRVKCIDASQPLDLVQNQIASHLKPLLEAAL